MSEEKIILRYLNSISTKHKDQYSNWLEKGTVSEKDAMIYAINPWGIPFDHRDSDPPRILQAGYTIWPAPGSADTELGVLMEPEVRHGETEVYTRVQA